MKSGKCCGAFSLVATAAVLVGFIQRGVAQEIAFGAASSAAQTSAITTPKDIYADSGFRLPLPKREALDDDGKRMYDLANSGTIAGLRGPSGIQLYSPRVAEHQRALNQYLRYEAGLSGRVRELAILVSAREADSQFEWTVHEPVALQEGLSQKLIDIVRYHESTDGLPETDTLIIQLGRQMFGQRKVTADTFARCLKLFGTRGLVNLVSLMGNYISTAGLLAAFDMQLPPGRKPLLPPR
jgi:4-carboxymuconolactone decarboxylase